jgi:hypothetical protein
LLSAVPARSQSHRAAQGVPFYLAVCTEAKPSVVELKVDTHTEVNPKFHYEDSPWLGSIPLLHSLNCSSRCILQATMSGVKPKPLILLDKPLEGGR